MAYPLQDKYINLLTDFGFKRVFGMEPNKRLLIDFLNSLLPEERQIADVTFKNTENLGSTAIDRKAIFDIYCQGTNGERFIVEIQKAKQNYFKDRSVYYATFPIQEQALKGEWNYKLAPVYAVGVLDFVFDDDKDSPDIVHSVELKDQKGKVFFDRLKFIYIELPKFKKAAAELETRLDKWMFVLKNLAELTEQPQPLQEEVFTELFRVAEIANFTPDEQDVYQNSLKYYRDLNNVVETSRQEGWAEGKAEGRAEGRVEGQAEGLKTGLLQGQRSLLIRQLTRKFDSLPASIEEQIAQLSADELEALSDRLPELETLQALEAWLRGL